MPVKAKNESVAPLGKVMGSGCKTDFDTLKTDYCQGSIESGKTATPVSSAPDRSIDCDYTK